MTRIRTREYVVFEENKFFYCAKQVTPKNILLKKFSQKPHKNT